MWEKNGIAVLFSDFRTLFRRAFCPLSATMGKNAREVDKP